MVLFFFVVENIHMRFCLFWASFGLLLWSLPIFQPYDWLFEWGQVLVPYLPLIFAANLLLLTKRKGYYKASLLLFIFSSLRLVDYKFLSLKLKNFHAPRVSQYEACFISINVLTQNQSPHLAVKEIESFLCPDKANVVLMIEINDEWVEKHLKPLETKLPLISAKPQLNNFGMALYSQIPVEDVQWLNLGSSVEFPAISAQLIGAEKKISFYGVHIMPPLSLEKSQKGRENREKFFHVYDKDISALKVVMGDFNATPNSHALGLFLNRGLHLASNGHFLNFTWKQAPFPWAWFDHILLSSNFIVSKIETSEYFGSDHRMIKAYVKW